MFYSITKFANQPLASYDLRHEKTLIKVNSALAKIKQAFLVYDSNIKFRRSVVRITLITGTIADHA